jgi:hypothetical protein
MLKRALLPFVGMQVELVARDGRVLYRSPGPSPFSLDGVGKGSNATRRTFQQFHENPESMRAVWEDAAQRAAQKIVADLRGP